MDIHDLSAVELINLYKARILSPIDVVHALFERIDTLNPDLNAFVTLNRPEALIQAKKAENAYLYSHPLRPLEGIPIAIKDLTNTKGIRTTYGCSVYRDNVPDRDATIVKRLKEAGAIIMGKTNTPEFGHKATTDNPLFGAARNPWNKEKTAGGSSGGSAAAVAAGFVPLAEGSDGGGSIRIPASLCGVYGFKPSFGMVPYDNHLDGVFGNHEPFIHYGTLSRSIDDAALMFDVIKGASAADPFSVTATEESAIEALYHGYQSFKIGWTLDFGMYEIDDEVKHLFLNKIDELQTEGFTVEPVQINLQKSLPEFIDYFEKLWTVGLAAGCGALAEKHSDQLSSGLLAMIERGKKLSAVEFKSLESYRAFVWHAIQKVFADYDILLSPTLAAPAFDYQLEGPETINGKLIKPDSDWVMTQIYNLTGHPAISIPIGFNSGHLPVGMQAAGGRFGDIKLLQFAKWMETIFKARLKVKA
ncbi:amidase/aspartyl-tRNA(Asn)/glutamyl-tRNA(Gln) amidotransferase subunit A [Scopulibacillus daqui]|uniref:Amidase/aspartyl-tRNA(Asn)/glutamyl-tRNA(Gln) amidotransferase subunit A n=1 Tax=Scopulibacillus daqui TaxID=1469162 RepID=A0ABS2Q3K8_9BACL|nr:amidase [Scopulibacillus daqui]MBM7646525.1 amidase/aspartyl-tRNA(Asn)/glutamyl-tRNA(Gln) amidotransferase subunit A [Scopulibacillus daqui]